jgi:hypothetical protein
MQSTERVMSMQVVRYMTQQSFTSLGCDQSKFIGHWFTHICSNLLLYFTNNHLATMSTAITKTGDQSNAVEQRVAPNQSLYIQNLPDKLQKEDVRRALYMLFSSYGPVLDVVVMGGAKSRGQGHVLFRDVHAATQAMRACQGFEFFGREMVSANGMERTQMRGPRAHRIN